MEFNEETDIDGTSGEHHMTQSDRESDRDGDGGDNPLLLHRRQNRARDAAGGGADGVFSSSPVVPDEGR